MLCSLSSAAEAGWQCVESMMPAAVVWLAAWHASLRQRWHVSNRSAWGRSAHASQLGESTSCEGVVGWGVHGLGKLTMQWPS